MSLLIGRCINSGKHRIGKAESLCCTPETEARTSRATTSYFFTLTKLDPLTFHLAMAEVVGLVSAGVGITAFALQISSGIRTLHQLQLKPEQAQKDVAVLLESFRILHQIVSSLKARERYQPLDDVISHVQRRYEDIEPILRDLGRKYQVKGERHRHRWKRVRSMLAEDAKHQMTNLQENINHSIMILHLYITTSYLCVIPAN